MVDVPTIVLLRIVRPAVRVILSVIQTVSYEKKHKRQFKSLFRATLP
jgi:hypothetical protein